MRILGMYVLMIFLAAGLASAATVNLTDGRVVQGDIIKQDAKSLQISVDGVTMTYYADEIKDIDGKPLSSGKASAVVHALAPAPADQPETPIPSVTGAQPETPPAAVSAPEAVLAPPRTETPIDPDKKALILKFIEVFGTRQALVKNFDLMLAQIQKEKPDEAQKIRQRIKVDEIIERLLPIYDHNFTSDDLKAFIAFYGSDEGQKLKNTIPEMMKESVAVSIKYMEEKFPEVKEAQQ